jgi:hypothetical protein
MNKLVASSGKSEDEVMAALRVTNYNADMAAEILKAHTRSETLSSQGSVGPTRVGSDDESLFSTEASSVGADKVKSVRFAAATTSESTTAHLFVDDEEEERQAQLAAETQRHMDEARERRELEELERREQEAREAHKRAEREKRETEERAKREEQERQERSRLEQESARRQRQHDDEPSAAGHAAPAWRGRLFLDGTTGKHLLHAASLLFFAVYRTPFFFLVPQHRSWPKDQTQTLWKAHRPRICVDLVPMSRKAVDVPRARPALHSK